MPHFPDLTPYTYSDSTKCAVNIGWLSMKHPFFPRGKTPDGFLQILKPLAFRRDAQSRGYHTCPFCFSRAAPHVQSNGHVMQLGSAEIHVKCEGIVYAAPNLVIHYIERHAYLPPHPFIDAVLRSQHE
ncbi:DUF7919 family protein [Streptomyces xanthochromogenes]